MKCLRPEEMEWYVTGSAETAHELDQERSQHIQGCQRCGELHRALLEEQENWSRELFAETLPQEFDNQVMQALEGIEIEPATGPGAREDAASREMRETLQWSPMSEAAPAAYSLPARTKKRTWRVAVAAAFLVLLMSAAAVYSVPTLAEKIRSLFTRPNVDIGLLRAQEFGLVQHPGIKVKNKGYTVKIDEAVGDPTRIIVALQLFGPDGKHDRDRLVLTGENTIKLRDEQGHEVGELYDMGATSDFYYLVAFFPEPLQADRITVDGQIRQLGNGIQRIPFLQGSWDFAFTIDLSEAKKRTTFASLAGEYTSPDGMTVRLKRLTRMVQGVRLELDTELSDVALARSPDELWRQQQLSFHFEDAQGEEIHSVNTRKTPTRDSLMTHSALPGDKPGVMHWSYTFKYLPDDQPYRFVLDSYSVPEREGASVEFEPARLKEHPVPFRFQGDELMLKDFTIEQPPNTNSGKSEGALHLDGTLINELSRSEWMLRDAEGREYPLSMRGSWGASATDWKNGFITLEAGRPGALFQFCSGDLLHIPEKLTLVRTVVDKRYTNVNWSAPMTTEASEQTEPAKP